MKRRAALASSQAMPAPKRRKTSQLAVTQAIVRKELRKRTDWKYTDAGLNTTSVSSGGQLTSLLGNLVRGDGGYDNFTGNHITPQAITLKYYWTTNQSYNVVRLMIFQWFDSSTPLVSGILQSTGIAGLVPISPTLVTNKPLMKILYDRTHIMAPTASDGTFTNLGYGTVDPVTVYIPGKRLRPVRYNASTTAIQDGNIFCLVISDDVVPTHPVVSWYSRITFADDD